MKLGETRGFGMPEFIGLPRADAEDALWQFRLEGKRLGNIHPQTDCGDDYLYTLRLDYRGEGPVEGQLRYTVYVREHETPRTLGVEEVTLCFAPGETRTLPVDFSRWIRDFGIYYMRVEFFGKTSVLAASCLFSVARLLMPDQKDDRFGMCMHFPYNGMYTKELIPQFARLGARFIRTDFGWIEAEKEPGVIQPPAYWEEIVSMTQEYDVELLAIIDYGNPLYDEGGAPYTAEGLAAFERYCAFLATHYKGKIKYFEIWNEYNIIYANPAAQPPETYAAMLKVAYKAIKAANPEAVVIGGGMCGIHFEWLRRVLNQETVSLMDAVSFHPYCSIPFAAFPDDSKGRMLRNVNEMHSITQQYGKEMPVWITEMGWASYRDPGGVTREVQAADAVRMFALGLTGCPDDRFIWYDFINDEFDKYEREHQFGILESYHASVRLGAKEAFAALCAFFSKLGRAAFRREVRLGEYTRLFEMQREGEEPVAIFWSLEESEPLTVKAAGETVRLTDMYGNVRVLYATDGWVTFPSDMLPQYIEGLCPCYEEKPSPIVLDKGLADCAAGESVAFAMHGAENLEIRTELPSDFTANICGTSLRIFVPVNAQEKTYPAVIECIANGRLTARLPISVRVVPAMEVTVKPGVIGENWCLAVVVENRSSRKSISGRFRLTEPEEWRRQTKQADYSEWIHTIRLSESARYQVGPLQSQTLLFSAPDGLDDRFHLIGTEILPDEGPAIYAYHRLSFFGIPKLKEPVVLDGRATREKWGEPQIILGEKDFVPAKGGVMQEGYGAEVFLRWDEKNFYLAARVHDATHHQDCTCGDLWQDLWDGDGIQFLLDPIRENRIDHTCYNEIGISRTSNTQQIVVWRWRTAINRGVQLIKEAACEIVREGDYTLYEAAFPWEILLPAGVSVQEGKDLGFALGINDNNGNGCVGRLIYHKGIGYWYDQEGYNPQLCGDMLLLP